LANAQTAKPPALEATSGLCLVAPAGGRPLGIGGPSKIKLRSCRADNSDKRLGVFTYMPRLGAAGERATLSRPNVAHADL
jgi:hypothetical protein